MKFGCYYKRRFHNDMSSPDFSSVAKLIANNCGGLPLAIVVIAGLLARTNGNLWIEISKSVGSYLFDEGCMNVLELSYKHLPEYLKPCLLYLGAFPEDSYYRVRQVTRLWIAEGFIKESEGKSLNDVAKEYLYELADRSLIIVVKMIIGEIHTFRVHDLIHNFCQKKSRDGNFFQLGHATSSFSDPSIYNHYRVSMPKLCDITAADKLPLSCCHNRSLLYFPSEYNYSRVIFSLKKFIFAHVLSLKDMWLEQSDFADVTSMIDLRHLEACVSNVHSIPSSISNLWNMQSLILKNMSYGDIALPETLWRMKSLRHVKVHDCKFEVSDEYELNACPQLDKVVSFSRPRLSSRKDVEWLLLRLPAVRKLNCILDFDYSIDEPVESFGFHKKLESLKLLKHGTNGPCFINFPSTLIKLTLATFELSSTAISSIGELHCLRILKLRGVSFPEATWEMEDVILPNLKFFELCSSNLALWNANTECFPCLERLLFYDTVLEELPPCFGEISSLKKILISRCPKLTSSALRVHEEQMDWGNKVELIGCSDEQLNYEAKLADLGIVVGVCADISERGV